MEGELRRIRSEFVKRVSNPVIEGLLDDLLHHEVLSNEDKDSVMENQTSTKRARCLIDMVKGKGERASQIMIDSMKERDNHLCSTLGLISSPAARVGLVNDKTVVKPRKRTRGQDLSDKQLRDVAKTLGPKWEQAAFRLGLKTKDLNKIKAEQKDEFMQKRKMLLLWKCQRPPGEATAQDLLRGLEDLKDLPVETHQLLKDLLSKMESSSSGSSLTKDTARMSLEDRHEEEDRSDSGLAKKHSKPVKKSSHSSGQGSRPGELPSPLPLERPSSDRKLDRNNETRSAGQALSDNQLRDVARTLGPKWEQAAFRLGLKTKDLNKIKAEQKDEFMQKRKMLLLWKCQRPPGEATAQDLLRGLEDLKDLPVETRQLLNEMIHGSVK